VGDERRVKSIAGWREWEGKRGVDRKREKSRMGRREESEEQGWRTEGKGIAGGKKNKESRMGERNERVLNSMRGKEGE